MPETLLHYQILHFWEVVSIHIEVFNKFFSSFAIIILTERLNKFDFQMFVVFD